MVSNVGLVDVGALGEGDLEHGDNSRELEFVKTLDEGFVLVNDGDVADLVDLVETLNAVLDELSQVDCALDSV